VPCARLDENDAALKRTGKLDGVAEAFYLKNSTNVA